MCGVLLFLHGTKIVTAHYLSLRYSTDNTYSVIQQFSSDEITRTRSNQACFAGCANNGRHLDFWSQLDETFVTFVTTGNWVFLNNYSV